MLSHSAANRRSGGGFAASTEGFIPGSSSSFSSLPKTTDASAVNYLESLRLNLETAATALNVLIAMYRAGSWRDVGRDYKDCLRRLGLLDEVGGEDAESAGHEDPDPDPDPDPDRRQEAMKLREKDRKAREGVRELVSLLDQGLSDGAVNKSNPNSRRNGTNSKTELVVRRLLQEDFVPPEGFGEEMPPSAQTIADESTADESIANNESTADEPIAQEQFPREPIADEPTPTLKSPAVTSAHRAGESGERVGEKKEGSQEQKEGTPLQREKGNTGHKEETATTDSIVASKEEVRAESESRVGEGVKKAEERIEENLKGKTTAEKAQVVVSTPESSLSSRVEVALDSSTDDNDNSNSNTNSNNNEDDKRTNLNDTAADISDLSTVRMPPSPDADDIASAELTEKKHKDGGEEEGNKGSSAAEEGANNVQHGNVGGSDNVSGSKEDEYNDESDEDDEDDDEEEETIVEIEGGKLENPSKADSASQEKGGHLDDRNTNEGKGDGNDVSAARSPATNYDTDSSEDSGIKELRKEMQAQREEMEKREEEKVKEVEEEKEREIVRADEDKKSLSADEDNRHDPGPSESNPKPSSSGEPESTSATLTLEQRKEKQKKIRWIQRWHPEHQHYWYYDKHTEESSWDKPDEGEYIPHDEYISSSDESDSDSDDDSSDVSTDSDSD